MPYRTTPVAPPTAGDTVRPPQPPILGDTLARVNGHVLVPERAGTVAGHPVNPTAYVGDELLVQGRTEGEAMAALVEAASRTGQQLSPSAALSTKRQAYVDALADRALSEVAERVWVTRLRLTPPEDPRAPRPDSWSVLQAYRELVGPDRRTSSSASTTWSRSPTARTSRASPTSPVRRPPGRRTSRSVDERAALHHRPRRGRPAVHHRSRHPRQPAAGLLAGRAARTDRARPHRRAGRSSRCSTPGSAGTTCSGPARRARAPGSARAMALGSDVADAELLGVATAPGDLDLDAGHGTFIAGIVRQVCPERRCSPSGSCRAAASSTSTS